MERGQDLAVEHPEGKYLSTTAEAWLWLQIENKEIILEFLQNIVLTAYTEANICFLSARGGRVDMPP